MDKAAAYLYFKEELEKCKESPYYYFTNYYIINGEKATTRLTEKEFNKAVKALSKIVR
jgi:hypothetical protein